MSTLQILGGVALGLLTNECTEVCPWAATKIIRAATRWRYSAEPDRHATRERELIALVGERPGKVLKLVTALGFAAAAIVYLIGHLVMDFFRQLSAGCIPTRTLMAFSLLCQVIVLSTSQLLPSSARIAVSVAGILALMAAWRADVLFSGQRRTWSGLSRRVRTTGRRAQGGIE